MNYELGMQNGELRMGCFALLVITDYFVLLVMLGFWDFGKIDGLYYFQTDKTFRKYHQLIFSVIQWLLKIWGAKTKISTFRVILMI